MRHVPKYVQCHIVENSAPLGVAAPYDGVTELWFDSAEEIAQAFNEPKYLAIIRPDEHKFAELADLHLLRNARGADCLAQCGKPFRLRSWAEVF